jgi:FtsZ-interacting cell division protein ZipA
MSTATQTPNATSTANVTYENYNLIVGWTKEEMAKPVEERKLKAYPESDEMEKDIAEGNFIESFRQTFKHPVPQNAEGVQELIPDTDEQFNLIAKQLTVKLVNKSRSTVLGKDFQPKEDVIDLTQYAGEKSERRLSAFEKTVRDISSFDPATRAQLLALLQSQLGATQ